MMNNVARIRVPSPEEFERKYVRTQTPVIITDLMKGQPLDELRTPDATVRAIGGMELTVQLNYTAGIDAAVDLGERRLERCSLGDYLEYIRINPGTLKMCIEEDTPRPLRRLHRVPAVCRRMEKSMLFVGNQGNHAHMHFDGDHRQVIMHQVFGQKRVVLIPPRESKKLLPTENISAVCIQNLSEPERRKLFDYTGAWDCVVNPGEAIYMPALYWHYLEYLETSLSVHFRFGQNRWGRMFEKRVHKSLHTQNVGARFLDERFARGAGRPALERLRRVLDAKYPNGMAQYRHVEGLCRELYATLCPDALQGTYGISDWKPTAEEGGAAFYDGRRRVLAARLRRRRK